MGEARATGDEKGPDPTTEAEDHEGPSIQVAIGLNVAINAVLNAAFGYAIAWLHWEEYTLAWYEHALHGAFETGFVREDLLLQGLSVGVIVTLIVAAILHRQWDGHHLQPGRIDGFELGKERSRGHHMAIWAAAMGAMGLVVSVLITAATVTGVEDVAGSSFALARILNGFIVGGVAGGLVTASWVTNLTLGNLPPPEQEDTLVARTMARSSRHPWPVLAVVLLATAGLGAGLADVHVNVDEPDGMPRGTGHHQAAVDVAESFEATHGDGFQLHFRADEAACLEDAEDNLPLRVPQQAACGNITDEVYVRAMDEVSRFLAEHTQEPNASFFAEDTELESPVQGSHGLPSVWKLANWTLAGGQDVASEDAYALPGADQRGQVEAVRTLAEDRLAEAQQATVSEDGTQATIGYQIDPDTELDSRQLGAFVLDARDAYLEDAGDRRWDVFADDNRPLVSVDQPVANAHHAQSLEEDASTLWTLVGLSLLAGLLLVFRNPMAAAIAGLTTALAGVWTLGTMGHADVALSQIDLLQAPLLLAASVFLTVGTLETYLAEIQEDEATGSAFRQAGQAATFPWYVGVLAAIAGLTVIGLGPTATVADAAWVSILGLGSVLVLTLTFLPATASLAGTARRLFGDEQATPGRDRARGWASRTIAAGLVLALTMASLAGVAALETEVRHEASEHWPADDELRREHEQATLGFHGLGHGEDGYVENAIVVQGEVTDPETLAYLQQLSEAFEAEAAASPVLETHAARDLPSVIRDWLEMCCGVQGVASSTLADVLPEQAGDEVDTYPGSAEETQATLSAMFDSPYAAMARPVVASPDSDTVVYPVHARLGDAAAAERSFHALEATIEQVQADEPADVTTTLAGPTATAHLTSEEQVPWLWGMLAAGAATATLLGLAYARRLQAGLVLALVVGLTSLWTLGALGLFGQPLTLATMLGLSVGLLAATGIGMRLVWSPRGAGTVAVFSVLVLAGLFGGLIAAVDASAGFPTLQVEQALASGLAALAAALAASTLVHHALAPSPQAREEATEAADPEVEPGAS